MINCPECDHPLKFHTPHCTEVNDNGCSCFCTVTYESLVGDDAEDISTCRRCWKLFDKTVGCDCQLGTVSTEMQPELSLLVIDLGNSCVIKVEKGDAHVLELRSLFEEGVQVGGQIPRTKVFYKPFTELREAIDGKKPVPRVERELLRDTYERYYVYFHDTHYSIPLNAYDALSQLAGKPLPIWKKGEWRKLSKTYDEQADDVPLTVWRYTR